MERKRKRRTAWLILLTVFILIFGLTAESRHFLKATENGLVNIVKRARQMTSIEWTPLKNIDGWKSEVVYEAGKTYRGLPYGQPVNAKYVPWSASLEDFMNAVEDPSSKMYTSYSSYGGKAPYYSVDCSAFVSWAWQLPSRQTTSTIHNFATEISRTATDNAELGDCLCKSGSHVVLITDIHKNSDDKVDLVEISEATTVRQTNYCCQVTRYGSGESKSIQDLKSKYFDSGFILYRSKTRNSVTYTHSCVVPLEGDDCPLCNTNGLEITQFSAEYRALSTYTKWSEPAADASAVGTGNSGDLIQCDRWGTDGNNVCWLHCIKGFWIKNENISFVQALASTVLSNRGFPEGQLPVGKAYPIQGILNAINPIIRIQASIIRRGSEDDNPIQQSGLNTNSVYTYSLRGSQLDNEMVFNALAEDYYTFQITVIEQCLTPEGMRIELQSEFSSEFNIGNPVCSHSEIEEQILVSPTCEESGSTQRYCPRCGYTEVVSVEPLGHDNQNLQIDPTCLEEGKIISRCLRCQKEEVVEILPIAEHQFIEGRCKWCGKEQQEEVKFTKGDLNGDGTVSSADAVLLARYNAGLPLTGAFNEEAADVNSDGVISAADAVRLARYLAGYIKELE